MPNLKKKQKTPNLATLWHNAFFSLTPDNYGRSDIIEIQQPARRLSINLNNTGLEQTCCLVGHLLFRHLCFLKNSFAIAFLRQVYKMKGKAQKHIRGLSGEMLRHLSLLHALFWAVCLPVEVPPLLCLCEKCNWTLEVASKYCRLRCFHRTDRQIN